MSSHFSEMLSSALVVEDWWADRLRFETILAPHGIDVTFAWSAGRPGQVWEVTRIADACRSHQILVLDLAWTRVDEALILRIREGGTSGEELRASVKELKSFELLTRLRDIGSSILGSTVIVTAFSFDEIDDLIVRQFGVQRYRKWFDENAFALKMSGLAGGSSSRGGSGNA